MKELCRVEAFFFSGGILHTSATTYVHICMHGYYNEGPTVYKSMVICVHTFTTYPIARVSNIAGTDVASFGVVTRGIGMTWFIQTLIFVYQYVIEADIMLVCTCAQHDIFILIHVIQILNYKCDTKLYLPVHTYPSPSSRYPILQEH